MKSVGILLILLLGWLNSLCSASEANEDLTRSLIVARLISQVTWLPGNFNQKSTKMFQLCIFDDIKVYRIFSKNLNEVEINGLNIRVINITEKEKAFECHAVFIPKSNLVITDWLVKNNVKNKTILITEKKSFSENEGHINIYLNEDGFFDFQLNPDAFETSGHNINPELFALGHVFRGDVAQKAKTVRTLINNTEWVNDKNKELTDTFYLCSYPNNPFATFANYFFADSDLKGRKVKLKLIESIDSIAAFEHCNALFLGDNDQSHFNWLMNHREALKLLLVNNGIHSEGNGAHYSLKLKDESYSRKFGINLLAFAITGHEPHYQLLNSAIIFKNDYPILGNLLAQIIESTQWPSSADSSVVDDHNIRFCNYQSELSLDTLKEYMLVNLSNKKKLIFSQLDEIIGGTKCDVIFAGKSADNDNNYLLVKKNYPKALVIANQLTSLEKITNQSIIHFNLSLKPKEIMVEAFLKNLKNSGFLMEQQLMKAVVIIGGDSND